MNYLVWDIWLNRYERLGLWSAIVAILAVSGLFCGYAFLVVWWAIEIKTGWIGGSIAAAFPLVMAAAFSMLGLLCCSIGVLRKL